MSWKESSVMEERLHFVARLLEGEGMSDVCRSFGISRKTGYKIFNRYKEHGLEALSDRSRRPIRYANQLPEPIERMIVQLKKEKPHWGARKIRELLVRRLAGDAHSRNKHSPCGARPPRPGQAGAPEAAQQGSRHAPGTGHDAQRALVHRFQGRVELGNGRYCYTLTIRAIAEFR
jgi:transposase